VGATLVQGFGGAGRECCGIFEGGQLSEQNARARARLGSPVVLDVLRVSQVYVYFARLLTSRRN